MGASERPPLIIEEDQPKAWDIMRPILNSKGNEKFYGNDYTRRR